MADGLQPGPDGLGVYFLAQGEQAGPDVAGRFAAFIGGARRSLDLAVYDMRLSEPLGGLNPDRAATNPRRFGTKRVDQPLLEGKSKLGLVPREHRHDDVATGTFGG